MTRMFLPIYDRSAATLTADPIKSIVTYQERRSMTIYREQTTLFDLIEHRKDSDCQATLGPIGVCLVCGVYHADPCPECGGKGYHADDCPNNGEVNP